MICVRTTTEKTCLKLLSMDDHYHKIQNIRSKPCLYPTNIGIEINISLGPHEEIIGILHNFNVLKL